ncbi:MAG: phage portal protein [Atopobiaceae bacterium]|nr:phage portal protein [Atopobiaceae bacterium]
MGRILDKILGTGSKVGPAAVETVGSRPYTTGWSGSMYQQVLVRSVIERFAVACSKLKPEIQGSARPRVRRAIETSPNEFQTWPQFLYRCATLYMNNTTVCVVPEYKPGTQLQIGFYPVPLAMAEVVEHAGEYWLRWTSMDGDVRAIELRKVAIVTRFQYVSDWFGDGNILANTLSMLKAQEDAQKQSMNDSAQLRFIGQLQGQVREEDMAKKRDRFSEQNLSSANETPLMVYDNTFVSIEQLKSQNWTIPSDEMERIENNVFDYFGTNRRILQNMYDENAWDAFYEGCIEPFALALGEAMTQATFTMRERPANRIMFSSNRLEYAAASSKRNINKDMCDRGIMTLNEAREILQLPPIDDGDVFILRGEYKVGRTFEEIARIQQEKLASSGTRTDNSEQDIDSQDGDTIRPDSDGYGSPGDTDTGDVTSTNQDRWSENAS